MARDDSHMMRVHKRGGMTMHLRCGRCECIDAVVRRHFCSQAHDDAIRELTMRLHNRWLRHLQGQKQRLWI